MGGFCNHLRDLQVQLDSIEDAAAKSAPSLGAAYGAFMSGPAVQKREDRPNGQADR